MNKNPLVIFIFSFEGSTTSTRYGGFAKRLQAAGGLKNCQVLTVALENLAFIVRENGEADVIDLASGQSMSQASLVYMKSWSSLPEEAKTLATYLTYKGIPFMDTATFGPAVSKISTAFRLWGHGIATPFTLYSCRHDKFYELLQQNKAELGDKFIVKDANGEKGKANYLVGMNEVPAVLAKHPDTRFIAQRFIPNDGDYRVGVYADKSSFVIKRIGAGDTHLNNVSAGGRAVYIKLADVPERLLCLAEKAAAAVDLQVSGVDIIIDQITKKPYILEINQGSQIVTGAFTVENIAALNGAFERIISRRYNRVHHQPVRVIGRHINVGLSQLGVKSVVGKVDTGAYSSTLHADNIRINEHNGILELAFDIIPNDKLTTIDGKINTFTTTNFADKIVRSSNGQIQHRYSIKTKIMIDGKTFPIVLTLCDRSAMKYPLLIGRRVLRSRFMVNVELSDNIKRQRGC